MNYYCARLLTVILVDDGRPRRRNHGDYAFVVFRARDYEHALELAEAYGKKHQTRYRNGRGQWVRWAFVGVQVIKHLGKSVDGQEVGSVMSDLRSAEPIPYKKRFKTSLSHVSFE